MFVLHGYTRPFNTFVEMELERDSLYQAFTKLDEPKEISKAWIDFAESCSRNLSAINGLTTMAFERISEVSKTLRENELAENPIPLYELLYGDLDKQLVALNEFQIRLSVLTYVYSQVRNRGVFSYAPKTSQFKYYINAKETLDLILYRILNDEIPEEESDGIVLHPTSSDLLRDLQPLIKLENMKRLIPKLLKLQDSSKNPKILLKIGEYDRLQGQTLLTNILDISGRASKDFWWNDPISRLSILAHSKEHFEAAIKLWEDIPGELGKGAMILKSEFLPVVDVQSTFSLAEHFKLLSKSAMESGDLNHTSKYLEEAVKQLKKASKIAKVHENTQHDVILQEIGKNIAELEIIQILSKLALRYTEIINSLYNNDLEEATKICIEMSSLLEKATGAGSLPYVYGVSVIYATASEIIVELLGQDISNLNIIDRLMSKFDFPMKAMSKAIADIDLSKIHVNDNNPLESFETLSELNEKLFYLERAIELLPPFLQERDVQRNIIHAIKYYIQSLLIENQIYLYADNNIVMDLTLRARAHYYSKKANQFLSSIKGNPKYKNIIKERMITTKVLGTITESNLISLGLQTSYNRDVRNMITGFIDFYTNVKQTPEFIIDSVSKQFEGMQEFHELLDLINIDTQELFAIQIDASIKGNDINWDFVKRRSSFIPASKNMFDVIKLIILGELHAEHKQKDKAIGCYNKASNLLVEISSELEKVAQYIEDEKELPQLVYITSLFCRENASALRSNRKRQKVPYPELISILDYLILNL